MSILSIAVYLLVICGAAALVYWAVDKLGTPDPLNRVVKVLTIVVAIVLVVMILLRLLGVSGAVIPPLA
jgi:hypothetical protein